MCPERCLWDQPRQLTGHLACTVNWVVAPSGRGDRRLDALGRNGVLPRPLAQLEAGRAAGCRAPTPLAGFPPSCLCVPGLGLKGHDGTLVTSQQCGLPGLLSFSTRDGYEGGTGPAWDSQPGVAWPPSCQHLPHLPSAPTTALEHVWGGQLLRDEGPCPTPGVSTVAPPASCTLLTGLVHTLPGVPEPPHCEDTALWDGPACLSAQEGGHWLLFFI